MFKRWSRKGYAIFAGLHRHIVIGTLSVSICSASMLKIASLITLEDGQRATMSSEREEGADDGAPPWLSDVMLAVCQEALPSATDRGGEGARAHLRKRICPSLQTVVSVGAVSLFSLECNIVLI